MPPPQENYDIPDAYDRIDELRVSSPSALPVSHNLDVEGASEHDGHWRAIQPGHGDLSREPVEEEYYTLPNNYSNLEEVTVPSPVESLDSPKPRFLEDLRAALQHGPEGSQEALADGPQGLQRQRAIEDLKTALQHGPEDANATGQNSEPSEGKDTRANMGICHALQSHSPGEASPSTDPSGARSKPTLPGPRPVSRFATELYTISYLIFFSILGTLARLGLQALTFYPGAPLQTGVLWANFAGSFFLGFLLEDRKLFRQEWGAKRRMHFEDMDGEIASDLEATATQEHAAVKKTIPLYIGLATGFCGSFTSFSSFIRDAYLALSNALPVPMTQLSSAALSPVSRNPGYGFLAVLAVIIITTALCLGALQVGAHLALALEPVTPSIPFLFARKFVDRAVIFIAWTSWLGAVVMSIWPPDRFTEASGAAETWRGKAVFAMVFAPPGCLLRFYASLHLNGRLPRFPLGTFAVNMLGTAIEGMLFDLQHVPLGGRVGCQVLQGAMDGFCGCLTTVSTWVAELKGSPRRAGYAYGLSSVGVGLGLAVIIMGSLQWTGGFEKTLCTH